MQLKPVLFAALGVAALALPAAVPASQPRDVRVTDALPVTATPAPGHFATLLTDPHQPVDLAIVMPSGFTTLDWIDQDPFAR